MRELFWACLVLMATSTGLKAAETIATPFKFEFYATNAFYDVSGVLKQSCRYEKIVFSDSAEFEAEWKETPLLVKKTELASGLTKVSVSLTQEKRMRVDGIFRPSKGCYSNIEVTISDTRYAIGWGARWTSPVSFTLRTDSYYKPESSLDISKVEDVIGERELNFFYKTTQANQVNVFLYIDGERTWDVFPINTLKNPETGLPYPLKKP